MTKGETMDLEHILFEKFSYTSFRTGQKEIIESVLEGQDTLALLPTGSGKSLCYQLPGYILPGAVLIVSPLISLMQDQVEQMKVRGEKRAVALNSFLSPEEKSFVLKNLHFFKFIYISPEMLQSELIIRKLQEIEISLFVIDEAHCISQWGYDFRPDYLELGKIRKLAGNPPILALTATAGEEVRRDIKKYLYMEEAKEYIYSTDRHNIAVSVIHAANYAEKREQLFDLVGRLEGPGILYFSSKKLADETAAEINRRFLGPAASYHADLDPEMRILLQQQFLYDELKIMCATSAFGMGINKENIRYIIHFHPPLTVEAYVQEIGRAGRDGKKSLAILLFSEDDLFLQQQLIAGELPTEQQIDAFCKWLEKNQFKPVEWDRIEETYSGMGGYSEVQWRLLCKFYTKMHNRSSFPQAMKKFVDQRLQIKNKKLNEMISFIHHQGCKREKLLRFFNEEKEQPIENCCDYCGIDFSFYEDRNHAVQNKVSFQWKKRLGEIFKRM